MKKEFFINKMRAVIALNKKLNAYKYGFVDSRTGKVYQQPTDDEFNAKYTPMTPSAMDMYKIGVCWDYSRYYAEKLEKMGYTTVNLFISVGPTDDFHTHTVTIISLQNIYVWVESSWKSAVGVYVSSDFDNLVDYIVKRLVVDNRFTTTVWFTVNDYYEAPPVSFDVTKCLQYYMSAKKIRSGEIRCQAHQLPTLKDIGSKIYLLESPASLPIFESGDAADEDEFFMEAKIPHTFKMKEVIEKKVFAALDDPVKRKKYARIQSEYMDRNAEKLATAGPEYLIVFGDSDHKAYLELFDLDKVEVAATMTKVCKDSGSTSDFKFLTQNPMLHILYFCIRYFTIKNDEKGVNSTLGIYALAIYWSTFTKYFPKGVIGPVMAYTIDNLTEKFTIKKVHTIFNLLMVSIQQSYSFHKKRFYMGGDDDITGFAQRIKNDQNSMIKKIAGNYMENWKAGKAISVRNDEYDPDNPIVDDVENATTIIATLTAAVVPQMISNGVDLRLAMAAAKISQISITDCREYLTVLITDKYVDDLESLVQSILYIFLITDGRSNREIKSQYFLQWGYDMFKKTNSKDPNVKNINNILHKWAEESGIYERYSGKGTRIGYKKAIQLYIILTIQKYV